MKRLMAWIRRLWHRDDDGPELYDWWKNDRDLRHGGGHVRNIGAHTEPWRVQW